MHASYHRDVARQVATTGNDAALPRSFAMPAAQRISIVNVGYRSTNFWVVSAGTSRLLVDLGWPGTMATLRAQLARMDIPLRELRLGLATHYHIDHAGLAQDLKLAGVPRSEKSIVTMCVDSGLCAKKSQNASGSFKPD